MAYTFDELKHKTVQELRDIAKGMDDESVQGYSQLNKEHLLEVLCKALHIDMHVHHHVEGINKKTIKDKIKALKKDRDAAIEVHDSKKLKKVRRQIHHLKRALHKATV